MPEVFEQVNVNVCDVSMESRNSIKPEVGLEFEAQLENPPEVLQYDALTAFQERVRLVFSTTAIAESVLPFILKLT